MSDQQASKSFETGEMVGSFMADSHRKRGGNPDEFKKSAERITRFFLNAESFSYQGLRDRIKNFEGELPAVEITAIDELPELKDAMAGVDQGFHGRLEGKV